MRSIDDYFSQTINKALYHYTGASSLLGIVNSKTIWASNIYYLNDSAEIVEACNVFDNVIRPRIEFGHNRIEIEFLKQLQEWMKDYRINTFNIFIFSLSEESSLLSQWRSYTPHGKGVSIGFAPARLNSIKEQFPGLKIAKCLYEAYEHEEIIQSLISKLLITFRQEQPNLDLNQAHPSQCYHPFLEKFRGEILQVLSIIKNRAFIEEQEWRLISPYYEKYTTRTIKFREGSSMLVPYIDLPLGENKPYFDLVTLGPSQHPHLSSSALSMFLSNSQACNTTDICNIPYREW